LDKLFDILLIVLLAIGVFRLGNYTGKADGYYLGVIAGYDLFYKQQYEKLLDSIRYVPFCD